MFRNYPLLLSRLIFYYWMSLIIVIGVIGLWAMELNIINWWDCKNPRKNLSMSRESDSNTPSWKLTKSFKASRSQNCRGKSIRPSGKVNVSNLHTQENFIAYPDKEIESTNLNLLIIKLTLLTMKGWGNYWKYVIPENQKRETPASRWSGYKSGEL